MVNLKRELLSRKYNRLDKDNVEIYTEAKETGTNAQFKEIIAEKIKTLAEMKYKIQVWDNLLEGYSADNPELDEKELEKYVQIFNWIKHEEDRKFATTQLELLNDNVELLEKEIIDLKPLENELNKKGLEE